MASVTGGDVFTPGNGYVYHVFSSTGPLVVASGEVYMDYMVIAGGGGGGSGWNAFVDTSGGGGGAGGYLEGKTLFSQGFYTISIGGGGSGTTPTNGTPSFIVGPVGFTSITATGGGAGGYYTSPPAVSTSGSPGGSGGGGGGANLSPTMGGIGIFGQGTYGAAGGNIGEIGRYTQGPTYSGGGGGGAAGIATDPSSILFGGNGGNGRVAFNGDSGIPPSYGTPGPTPGRFFAGGGGGGNGVQPTPIGGSGGIGGGGNGGDPRGGTPQPGVVGNVNTGSGGGGGCAQSPLGSNAPGGSGGSGIVILRRRNDYEYNLVKTNLVLNLDAGNYISYPGSGTIWNDLSGNGNSATINTDNYNILYSTINKGAFYFNGSPDNPNANYFSIPNTAFTLGANFTIEIWNYYDSASAPASDPRTGACLYTNSALADWNTGAGNNNGLLFGYGAVLYVNNSGTTIQTNFSTPTTRAWHHHLLVVNNGTGRVYIDGASVATLSNMRTYTQSNGTLGIGQADKPSISNRGQYLGYIPVVNVYTKALTISEVLQNYNTLRGRYGI